MALANIRQAVLDEIKRVTAELKHLQSILSQLGNTTQSGGDNVNSGRKKPGRPAKGKSDPDAVLALIKQAGKINAVSLGHQVRKAGLQKVPTAQLIELGVKVAGKKGATTYSFAK